jgi:hypothetical protein
MTTKQVPNTKRADKSHKRIEPIVLAWMKQEDCDPFDSIVDLLADIRHYCDRECLDFADLDHCAHRHYRKELTNA